jgi:hypothetical protein
MMETKYGNPTLTLLGICLFLFTGCLSKRAEMGVRNYWRDPSLPAFETGRTTQSDVMRALGPPSQVIALPDQTLFYYLREQSRTKAGVPCDLQPNSSRNRIRSDDFLL